MTIGMATLPDEAMKWSGRRDARQVFIELRTPGRSAADAAAGRDTGALPVRTGESDHSTLPY